MRARKRSLNITCREAWPIWLAFGVVFGIGAIGVWVVRPATQVSPKALHKGEDVSVGPAELPTDVPKFFSYPGKGDEKVEFFVEREAGDNITAAFASCRRCFGARYYRQGRQVFCGHCNQPMERIANGQTPALPKDCTQIPIPFERSGDHLIIRASVVADAFARWYRPVIVQDQNLRGANQN